MPDEKTPRELPSIGIDSLLLHAYSNMLVNGPEFPRHPAGSVFAASQILLVTACRF